MPCTLCKITPQGIDAFEEYVEAYIEYTGCTIDYMEQYEWD